jgi:hypothetical protein
MFVSKLPPALILLLPLSLYAAVDTITQIGESELIFSIDNRPRPFPLTGVTLQPAFEPYLKTIPASYCYLTKLKANSADSTKAKPYDLMGSTMEPHMGYHRHVVHNNFEKNIL